MANWKNLLPGAPRVSSAQNHYHPKILNFIELTGKVGVAEAGHECSKTLRYTVICFPNSVCTGAEQNPKDT